MFCKKYNFTVLTMELHKSKKGNKEGEGGEIQQTDEKDREREGERVTGVCKKSARAALKLYTVKQKKG